MKILIATPLYPPDIAEPAPYVKELATRLKDKHSITILAYNHIPEEIPGVRIITIEKNKPLIIRLYHYIHSLYSESKKADLVYMQNGPSTEFPLIIVAPFIHTPFILHIGDETALSHAIREKFHTILLRFAMHYSLKIITHKDSSSFELLNTTNPHILKKIQDCERPLPRPEILPFKEFPKESIDAYEASWIAHTTELIHIFSI